MAIDTLFNRSYEELLKRARIETATEEQTVMLVNMSVSEVRIGFYDALGTARVNEIKAFDLVDNPSTDEELLRAKASNIEALWLTYLLIPRLPNNFMAAGNLVNQQWNEEPLTRDSDNNKAYLDILKKQIDEGLADLVEDPEDYDTSAFRAASTGSEEEPYIIGDNFPGYVRPSW